MRFTALLGALLLTACSSAPSLPSSVANRLTTARQLDVPFIDQQDYYCGPAALSSIAQYRGVAADQQSVASMSFIPGRRGSLSLEMQAASRRLGLLPYPLAPSLSALLSELDAGNPVLVLQNLGLSWWPQWHYAVALGYDLAAGELLLHSGSHPYYRLGFDTFYATWARAQHWARVPVGVAATPVSAEAIVYLQAAHAFEETGQLARALAYYRRATEQWPEHVVAWLALANVAYQLADTELAMRSYERALNLAPERAGLWNNYAYSLQAAGCQTLAEAAIRRARLLAPEDGNIADSAAELAASKPQPAATTCPSELPNH
ncbi:PA2778 family cysteine peptidase [Spongiibacter sp.]|uniref:PA2778 family cysteine peptidase n=1 Tax=Spongiibacter sp. TaxID=2024860 RepID=UPI003568E033